MIKHYRYFTGIYHFFGSFSGWYGNPKSGMVTLVFGSTTSGQGWFAESHGESSSPRTTRTRFLAEITENGPCIPYFFTLSYLTFGPFRPDSRFKSEFRAGRRPADEISLHPLHFRFLREVTTCPNKWYVYRKKVVFTTFRFPSPPHVWFRGTRIPVMFHH